MVKFAVLYTTVEYFRLLLAMHSVHVVIHFFLYKQYYVLKCISLLPAHL